MHGDPTVDDSGEMLTYRLALWGLLIGGTIMVIWLTASGIPFYLVIPFLLVALVLFIGLTRIVAESGMAEAPVDLVCLPPLGKPAVMVSPFRWFLKKLPHRTSH